MSTQFWANDPAILLNKKSVCELWPTQIMNYNQKLNAITRLIILLTLLGYILTKSLRLLVVALATIIAIFILYRSNKAEGFDTFADSNVFSGDDDMPKEVIETNDSPPISLESVLKADFQMGNKKNPYSNVLLTDIADNPNKKPAPPAFNPEVDEQIVRTTKKLVQSLNPGIKNAQKQLFGDLYNNFELDQSNRRFFSTANTKIANDQGAFGEFLYGYMPSGKESNADGALARVQDTFRYNLY
jgi:hypothetical protein